MPKVLQRVQNGNKDFWQLCLKKYIFVLFFAFGANCKYSVHNQMQRDNTSVDSIYLTKMQMCLYGLKALSVSLVEVRKLGG